MTKLPMFTYFLHVIKMTFVAYKTNKEISEYCTDLSTDISVQFNTKKHVCSPTSCLPGVMHLSLVYLIFAAFSLLS